MRAGTRPYGNHVVVLFLCFPRQKSRRAVEGFEVVEKRMEGAFFVGGSSSQTRCSNGL